MRSFLLQARLSKHFLPLLEQSFSLERIGLESRLNIRVVLHSFSRGIGWFLARYWMVSPAGSLAPLRAGTALLDSREGTVSAAGPRHIVRFATSVSRWERITSKQQQKVKKRIQYNRTGIARCCPGGFGESLLVFDVLFKYSESDNKKRFISQP